MIIAEFSHNHKGKLEILESLVRESSRAGARFCKIQSFFAEDLTPEWKHTYDFVKSYELSWHKHKQFHDMCRDYKVEPMTTVYSKKYAQEISNTGIRWIKIGSPQATDTELIEFYKAAGFKLIVSTGGHKLADLKPVFPLEGVLHCNSVYPTPPNQVNLARMLELKKLYPKTAVGFSSHVDPLHPHWNIPLHLASYLGATYIEVHFTVLPREETKDGKVSLVTEQLKEICEFDYLPQKQQLATFPWAGYFKVEMDEQEIELISNYKKRWIK